MFVKKSFPKSAESNKHRFQISVLGFALSGILLIAVVSQAQPAVGANKFVGNITTRGQVRNDFGEYWNQITGENEHKWASVERTRDQMSWGGGDRVADYAREHGIPWKFHTLVWGSQQPQWISNLSQSEQLEEIEEWFDAAAERYPDVTMIDVVNEGHPNHAPAPYRNALGGNGSSGYDWIANAFKMARERWPHAILIYNDYNNIEWSNEVNWTPTMVNAILDAGAPIDAIGCQAHDAYRIAANSLKSNLDKLASTGLPLVVSEFDIPDGNDASQRSTMEEKFSVFWNHPKVVGITLWGYVVGSTWKSGTGILNTDGSERPALTWLMDYVEQNPDPPNDFPGFIEVGSVGTISSPFISIPQDAAMQNGGSLLKIFDLQGKMIDSRFINDQTIPLSSMMPSQKSYVVTLDGKCTGIINKLR